MFYWTQFGVPNLVVREGWAGGRFVSFGKASDIFFDLTQGVLPYTPLLLVLFLLGAILATTRRDWFSLGLFGATLGMAAMCTATIDWNSSCIGPMRYVIWLLPVMVWMIVRVYFDGQRFELATSIVLVASLGAMTIAAATLPLVAPSENQFNYLGYLVLERAPELYSPEPEVFVKRTQGTPSNWRDYVPCVLMNREGEPLKALLKPDQVGQFAASISADPGFVSAHCRPSRDHTLLYASFPPSSLD